MPPSLGSSDPLEEVSLESMQRLLNLYSDQLQFIYQMADTHAAWQTAAFVKQQRGIKEFKPTQVGEGEIANLKMVLANAM